MMQFGIFCHAARAAGLHSVVEQVIPELATADRAEPRVDVDAWGHPAAPRTLLDVTVCAPFADRYAKCESATASAEARKDTEYPAQAGLRVTGVAVDLFGRLGPGLSALLEQWADLARQRDLLRGRPSRRWLHTWRSQISCAVAKGVARLLITADVDAQQSRPRQTCVVANPLTTEPEAAATNFVGTLGAAAEAEALVHGADVDAAEEEAAAALHDLF